MSSQIHLYISNYGPRRARFYFLFVFVTPVRRVVPGVAEGAQTWGGHFRIFIYTALSAALRATSLRSIFWAGNMVKSLQFPLHHHPQDKPPCSEFESYLWPFRKVLPARQYL